ncbi:ATP-binding protein [Crossiella cryophila]|uniref:DNA-binding CsgD family transcriptional regulator n=1 Tax=Crossiella cryophila TaxID=43355 RepID=A0A7W7FU34_9PSEU|nr:helix-turn-helix transcriptional regulator [Crossiella cryophila]MBB4678846.1 DNA-binding CsgD family transcriptional regulator [Crossiella cryophila]
MGARTTPELLDREDELARLTEEAALSAAGSARVVLVEGPAGIGKTSLVQHFTNGAVADTATVLRAWCGEWERAPAFGMVRQLFRPLLAGVARDDLLSGPAGPAALVLTEDAAAEPPADAPFAVLHGLYWLCANAARRGPLVLVVDDAHLADAPSLRWLRYAGRRLRGYPVLFLLTRRTSDRDAPPDPLAWLATDPRCGLIRPGLLSEAGLGRLLTNALAEPPTPELVRACHQATGGNPLLARSLAMDPAGPRELSRFTSLRFADTVRGWLAGFTEAGRAFAGALAVLGECADPGLLARLTGLDLADCRRAGDHLWQLGLLRPGLPLRWSHPLLREVVYEQLGPRQRDDWHRRAATLLHDDGAPLEQVCAHLRQAAPAADPWTVSLLCGAATQAIGRGAPDVAADYLARALAEPPPAAERVEVVVRHGLAAAFVSPADSIEHLLGVLPEIADPPTRLRVAVALSETLTGQGREPEAIEVLGRAADELAGSEPDVARILRGRWLMMSVDHSAAHRAEVLATDGAALPCATPGERVGLVALAHGKALYNAPARETAALAARALRATPVAELANPLHTSSVAALTWADELDLAAHYSDQAIAGARRTHSIPGLGLHLALRAQVSLFAGKLAEAELFAGQADELVPEELAGFMRFIQLGVHGSVLLDQGRAAEAEELLHSLAVPVTRTVIGAEFHQAVLARIRIERGEVRAGLTELLAVGEVMRTAGHDNPVAVPWRAWAVRALLTLNEQAEAVRLAEESLELARQWGTARAIGTALGLLGLATGDLALLAEATGQLAGAPVELTRALLDTGALLAERGDLPAARTALRRALETADRCGAGGLAAAARDRLAAAGGRFPTRPAAGLPALSQSERRVVELAAGGYTNRRIAAELHLTLRTVETHLSTSYRKLGIRSRAELPGQAG